MEIDIYFLFCRQLYQKTIFFMINLDDFSLPLDAPQHMEDQYPSPAYTNESPELEQFRLPDACHQDEDYIRQIREYYDNVEHSQNILDRMETMERIDSKKENMDNTEEENSEEARMLARMAKRIKNQTKNIPKNFGKGIITFVERNQSKIRALAKRMGINFPDFLSKLKDEKRSINTIADLRRLWTMGKEAQCLRMISNLFLRRYALEYIFNSRISNFGSHIKYRASLWEAIKDPSSFNHIKQY